MRSKLAIAVLVGVLASCTTAKPTPLAYDCPSLELPPDPPVTVRSITASSHPNDIVKAWVAMATDYYQWNQVVHAEVETSR
jgi:hypothetical protein